jgi:hypothetical protein
MYSDKVTYEDYDGKTVTEILYFNLNKVEVADNAHLKDRFERLEERLSGEQRELQIPEIQEILNLVKEMMRISYGIRSDDGRRFIKSDELWVEFTQTAMYDDYLLGLFEDPKRAIAFLTGIMPKSIREEAEPVIRQMEQNVDEAMQKRNVFESNTPAPVAPYEAPSTPQLEFTRQQMLDMSDEEFEKHFGTDPLKMSEMGRDVLEVAFERRSRGMKSSE